MRFWDSSAVVPLLVDQPASAGAAAWVAQDPELVLWTLTPCETTSALARLLREGRLDDATFRKAERRAQELALGAHLVLDVEAVKPLAARLLRIHPLRSFDALQLGAALHWAEGRPAGLVLHSFDERLARAARLEGFEVPDRAG